MNRLTPEGLLQLQLEAKERHSAKRVVKPLPARFDPTEKFNKIIIKAAKSGSLTKIKFYEVPPGKLKRKQKRIIVIPPAQEEVKKPFVRPKAEYSNRDFLASYDPF